MDLQNHPGNREREDKVNLIRVSLELFNQEILKDNDENLANNLNNVESNDLVNLSII